MNGVRGQVVQYHVVVVHKRGQELVLMTQEISASHSVNKKLVSVTVIGMMVRMEMSLINIYHDQIHRFLGKYCGRELANMILYFVLDKVFYYTLIYSIFMIFICHLLQV